MLGLQICCLCSFCLEQCGIETLCFFYTQLFGLWQVLRKAISHRSVPNSGRCFHLTTDENIITKVNSSCFPSFVFQGFVFAFRLHTLTRFFIRCRRANTAEASTCKTAQKRAILHTEVHNGDFYSSMSFCLLLHSWARVVELESLTQFAVLSCTVHVLCCSRKDIGTKTPSMNVTCDRQQKYFLRDTAALYSIRGMEWQETALIYSCLRENLLTPQIEHLLKSRGTFVFLPQSRFFWTAIDFCSRCIDNTGRSCDNETSTERRLWSSVCVVEFSVEFSVELQKSMPVVQPTIWCLPLHVECLYATELHLCALDCPRRAANRTNSQQINHKAWVKCQGWRPIWNVDISHVLQTEQTGR